MATIFSGRYTTQSNEPFAAVFLIGIRLNRFFQMPRLGLLRAFELFPVTGRLDSARSRMNKSETDSVQEP
jgi:hypothetical protein